MHWFLFLNPRLPFDAKNPLGYLIVVSYQCIGAVFIARFFATVFSFALGACLLQFSITTDLKRSLRSINNLGKMQAIRQQITVKQLVHTAQLHSALKQFVDFALFFGNCFQNRINSEYNWQNLFSSDWFSVLHQFIAPFLWLFLHGA